MSEKARTEKVEYYCFEYSYFDVLCKTLDEIIQEGIANEQKQTRIEE